MLQNLFNLEKEASAGNPYFMEWLDTVDRLVLTSLYQLLLILKTLLSFLQKQATLMRRLTVLSLPLQLLFLGYYVCGYHTLQPQYNKCQSLKLST